MVASSVLSDQGFYQYIPLVLGSCLGLATLTILGRPPARPLDEFGLAAGTSGYRAEANGFPVNATADRASLDRMHAGWLARGRQPYSMLLGNSQLDSINQYDPAKDRNAPDLLFSWRDQRKKEVLTINMPNATLSEFLVLFEYTLQQQRPDMLVVAACFDDTREEPLRASVVALLADPGTAAVVAKSPAGARLIETVRAHDPARNPNQEAAADDIAGLADTVQQRAEAAVNDFLAARMLLWRERPTMRGRLATTIYKLRNYALGISAQSKRRVIPPRYAQHIDSLNVLLKRCRDEMIDAVVYIPPLRDDVETPYLTDQYDAFKRDTQQMCHKHSAIFRNLEHLVPAEYWGTKESTSGHGQELDFMHFQGPGHVLLADALRDLIATAGHAEN